MSRSVKAFILALVAILGLSGIVYAASGTSVPTLEEFNDFVSQQDTRDDAQDAEIAELKNRPTPTVTVTPTPTPTATPTPTETTTTAPPTTSPPATTFPDAASTGPSGTLTTTSGNPWISTPGTIIENRRHTGTLQVAATGVIIRNVHLIGNITVASGASVTITDTLVNNGRNFNSAGVGSEANITIKRTEIVGGGHSFSCKSNCVIEDNWFHGQADPTSGDPHGDGILFNEASNMIVRHNTLACDMPANGNGACSAGLAMYGDWGPIRNVVVDNNLFKASPAGYCMYGGELPNKPYRATNVDVTNNVFERGSSNKCAVFGPAVSGATDSASTWSGNKYVDGVAIPRP